MEALQKSVDSEVYDITIIGAGPTGLFGAFYAGLRNMKTKIIDARPEPGGQLTMLYPDQYIYDIPGYPRILASDLVKNLMDQATQFNPKILLGEKVDHLARGEDSVIRLETDKAVHFCKAVIICMGAGALSQNRLDIPSVKRFEGRGVFYHLENVGHLRGARVLIVGGGDTAVGWALKIKDWASRVILIHRSGTFRAREAGVVELFHSKVEVKIPYELGEVVSDNIIQAVKVFNNKTGEEEVVEVDRVLIGIGYSADLSPLFKWGLQLDGEAIKVNGMMESNTPGVYVAGDMASVVGASRMRLIATGFAQATIAVNRAKKYMDPSASVFPGHSSEKRF